MARALSWNSDQPLPIQPLSLGAVDLWIVDMATSCSSEQLVVFLSDEERQRAARYKHSPPRDQFIFGRGTLRHLLGQILDRDPRALAFGQDADGKPRLLGDDQLQFNLSHSQQYLCIALAQDRAVGVDLESTARHVNIDAIARQFFEDSELEQLNAVELQDRMDKFFELWTRKEALVKCLGMGWAKYMSSAAGLRESFRREIRIQSLRTATLDWLAIAASGDWKLRLAASH